MPARARIGVGLALAASLLVLDLPMLADAPSAEAAPPATSPADTARAHLAEHGGDHGLTPADVGGLQISSVVPREGLGTVVYLQQTVAGIDVAEAILNVLVGTDGEVRHVAGSTVRSAALRVNATAPGVTDVQAARAAARALGLEVTGPLRSTEEPEGADLARELGDGGVSTGPIPANLVYAVSDAGRLRLAWQLVVDPNDDPNHLWQVRVDALSGRELERHDWVAHADDPEEKYQVHPLPIEAPSFGARQVITDPADDLASPYGWLDTDGVDGAESTMTIGNNVHAYTDVNNDNLPDAGSEADGGPGLDFTFPLDLDQEPDAYRDAAVTNLFATTNRLHDVLYHYGFTEAAGNFQTNNYDRGGLGGDAVRAEASDGRGKNNANFATPPDGQPPRMQMYLWDYYTDMTVDGSLDNSIIAHEYAHGVSNRLTGGPATTDCLQNGEQAGEGWSDFIAYLLTQPLGTTDEPPGGRGIATYVFGEETTGVGIRRQRYSRDPAINTLSYDDIKTAHKPDGTVLPHDVGEVWGQMLWRLTWDLVDEYGYNDDLIGGTGGNNRALQLVLDGLTLQPCSPGFVDARDAILAADQARYAGANECLIWQSFAAEGLGYGARQGSSIRIDDGAEAYDLPPHCVGLAMTSTTTPAQPVAGRPLTHTVRLANTSGAPLAGVEAAATIDADATYVPGSATCAGTYDAATRTVDFAPGALAAGESRECSYRVVVAATPSVLAFAEDFEAGAARWTVSHDLHADRDDLAYDFVSADWGRLSSAGADGGAAMHARPPGTGAADQWLTTTGPISIPEGATLAFDHRLAMEEATAELAYDGAQVLVSTDGGASWEQPPFTRNGPQHTVVSYDAGDAIYNSVIAGETAFSSGTEGWIRTTADLSAYAGRPVRLAFRAVSDGWVGTAGWWVDNVTVGDLHELDQHVTYGLSGGSRWTAASRARIVAAPPAPPAPVKPAAPRVTKPVVKGTSVRVRLVPGAEGTSRVTRYAVTCVPTGKINKLKGKRATGKVRSASGAKPTLTVRRLTAGKTYRCRATATSAVGTSPVGPWSAKIKVKKPRTRR